VSWELRLYSRRDCCLCEEMKKAIGEVAAEIPLNIEEIDVDADPGLEARFGHEVPVLFINGRKAFKYRAAVRELKKKLRGVE